MRTLTVKRVLLGVFAALAVTGCGIGGRQTGKTLELAGNNRAELEKVLVHYTRGVSGARKLDAAKFLIANMPGNYSLDTTCLHAYRPVLFIYDSLLKAKEADPRLNVEGKMDSLWQSVLEKHSLQTEIYSRPVLNDERHVTTDYLTGNIDLAFAAWHDNPWHDSIHYTDFRDYVLPYRRLQGLAIENWRNRFYAEHYRLAQNMRDRTVFECIDSVMSFYSQFENSRRVISDYPYLKMSDFFITERVQCKTKCVLNSMILASVGFPVAVDFTPAWGRRNGGHDWSVLIYNGETYPFEPFRHPSPWKNKELYNNESENPHSKEFRLAKVYRNTYKAYPEGPATDQETDDRDIPALFLNDYKMDVSAEYFQVYDVEVALTSSPVDARYAYLCVFDRMKLAPVQWAGVNKGKAVFKNMGQDIIYVPAYCENGKLLPAGPAFYLGQGGNIKQIVPDKKYCSVTLERKFSLTQRVLGWPEKIKGGKFQGASLPDFSDTFDLFAVTIAPALFPVTVTVDKPVKIRYARFLYEKGKFGDLAELVFYEKNGTRDGLAGNCIFPEWLNAKELGNIFDGDILTFIPQGEIDTAKQYWIGIDFERNVEVSEIGLCPRTDANNIFPGLNYELLYWNNRWISAGRKKALSHKITFDNVHANALFLLRCLDEGREERIFTYEDGMQVWR